MKHFLLKFNHGVEIGARLAYLGHAKRTGDLEIQKIADEEEEHRITLFCILQDYNERPSYFIDSVFTIIGGTVGLFCKVCPLFTLNWVARTMETFAIFNYINLSKKYPEYTNVLGCMAFAEEKHKRYFSK
jgi:rubrerythrin